MIGKGRLFINLLLMFCIVNTTIAQTNLGLPYIRYYSTSEYDAGIQNWHISQDSRGIIYAANNFGLLEFDGSKWRLHAVVNGVKVRHFDFRNDGRIAVASQGEFGYFKTDTRGRWVYESMSDRLPEEDRGFEETWKVFNLGDKDYFCTAEKIFVVKGDSIDVIKSDSRILNFFLVNQLIYVYKNNKGLEILKDGKLIPVNSDPRILYLSISEIIPLSNNRLMIITKESGVLIIEEDVNSIWRPDQQKVLSQSSVNTALRLRNGDYAIGTQNNGIMIYSSSGELKTHLNKEFGLNDRTIICLFEDKQGNLWAGHNNGISYIEFGLPFTFINEHIGLPGTGYDGFQANGQLYLGTNNGLFKNSNINNEASDKFEFIEGTQGQVYQINKFGDLFLLGHNEGSFSFGEMQKIQRLSTNGTWNYQILRSDPDYIIAGTYTGLELYEKSMNSITSKHNITGFNESCRVFEQDDDGNIWMTHGYKGVFRFRLSKDLNEVKEVKFYGEDQGLPSNMLINVFNIRNELVFTTIDGVYKYNPDTDVFFKDPFYEQFFEPNSPLNVLAEDADQNIYFLGQQEIGMLRKDASGTYHKKTDTFNKINGLLNDDLQNISILENNAVLFGAKEGFIIYDATKDLPINHDFDALLRQVTLTGHTDSVIYYGNQFIDSNQNSEIENNEVITLPYSDNSLRFEYSATFMDGQQKTTYQYMLEGFDDDWSNWENKTDKEYTNLYEGNYTFKIKAKNLYGQVSPEASYRFQISPPWFRTQLAYFSYFLLFSIIIISLIVFLTRRHKKEKHIIIQKQESELNRRDSELKNIKSESEKEIEKLRTEKLKADIKHKNKELATATMHLMNKNEFIANVKQNLTSLVRNNPKDPLNKDLEKIMASIERNISDDDDWKHFENHFDQVHGDFSKRLNEKYPNLSPQDRRLCAYLRMNMTTKEIANLLNITVRGAEISRYRLRKKLDLSRETNLAEFILNF